MKAWLVTLVVISLVLFGLYSYKSNSISSSTQAPSSAFEPAATVEFTETSLSAFQHTTRVTGVIKAPQQLTLKNELAGKITELLFNSGDVVAKGQILLRIDVSNEQAALGAAKARLILSEQTLKRFKKLVNRKEISADLVDKASSELAIAKSDIEILLTKIDKKIIKAPFKAVVGLHDLTIGQYLDGNSSITELVGVSNILWVEFSLPESLPELAIGEQVNITNVNGFNSSATVIATNPTLAEQSRQLKYRAQFSYGETMIKPNALVSITAPIGGEQSRISIPDLALTHDQFGDYVFVLTPEDNGQDSYRAKRTQVWMTLKNDHEVVLEKGLKPGQLIATTGAFKLREGMKVFIAQAKAQ